MLPVLNPGSVSSINWLVVPNWYGTVWLSENTVCAKPLLPLGASAMVDVSSSPSPCVKSVDTLVWRWSYESTSVPRCVMRTREVAMGWSRPWRKSSVRCHMSFTGLPIAFDTSAASMAASENRCRPKEPPPCATWQTT